MSAGGAEWTARPMTRADVPAILALVTQAYGGANVTASEAYWHWKHQANPFGESPGLLAEADGKLVGVRVFMRWTWHTGDRSLPAVRAVDTATHPDWRGKKIFSKLTEDLAQQMKAEGVRFIFNTPNDKSRPGYLKLGWQDVTRVPVWIKPLRPWRLLRRKLEGSEAAAPDLSGLPTVQACLDEVGEQLRDLGPGVREHRLHTHRRRSYLQWRYDECPILDYRAVASSRTPAMAVCRGRTRKGLSELTFTELLIHPSVRGIATGRRLVSDVCQSVDADWATAVAARGSAESIVLASAGFVPLSVGGPRLTARPLADSIRPSPLSWHSWRCSLGDLELF